MRSYSCCCTSYFSSLGWDQEFLSYRILFGFWILLSKCLSLFRLYPGWLQTWIGFLFPKKLSIDIQCVRLWGFWSVNFYFLLAVEVWSLWCSSWLVYTGLYWGFSVSKSTRRVRYNWCMFPHCVWGGGWRDSKWESFEDSKMSSFVFSLEKWIRMKT